MCAQVAVTVLGTDRPGIVCEVASILAANNCNIDDLTQTVLQDEFAGIFLVSLPVGFSSEQLLDQLKAGLTSQGLVPYVKPVEPKGSPGPSLSVEPFVVVCIGFDQVGLIAAVTCEMKRLQVNITNLNSVPGTSAFADQVVTIFEVDVPADLELLELTTALQQIGVEKDIEVTVQHKRIFEDICRL
ncbi:MAG: ACT domain-containing protein [Desulfovermiculus sp.]|nr:ACT domain-containing protein [Desulfovermiculus sp.]